jgi:hypothetical protein
MKEAAKSEGREECAWGSERGSERQRKIATVRNRLGLDDDDDCTAHAPRYRAIALPRSMRYQEQQDPAITSISANSTQANSSGR